MIDRRTLLRGIGAVLAAPAIVRASSLMPVKAWAPVFDTSRLASLLRWGAPGSVNDIAQEIVSHIAREHGEELQRLWEQHCLNDMKLYGGQQWPRRPGMVLALKQAGA